MWFPPALPTGNNPSIMNTSVKSVRVMDHQHGYGAKTWTQEAMDQWSYAQSLIYSSMPNEQVDWGSLAKQWMNMQNNRIDCDENQASMGKDPGFRDNNNHFESNDSQIISSFGQAPGGPSASYRVDVDWRRNDPSQSNLRFGSPTIHPASAFPNQAENISPYHTPIVMPGVENSSHLHNHHHHQGQYIHQKNSSGNFMETIAPPPPTELPIFSTPFPPRPTNVLMNHQMVPTPVLTPDPSIMAYPLNAPQAFGPHHNIHSLNTSFSNSFDPNSVPPIYSQPNLPPIHPPLHLPPPLPLGGISQQRGKIFPPVSPHVQTSEPSIPRQPQSPVRPPKRFVNHKNNSEPSSDSHFAPKNRPHLIQKRNSEPFNRINKNRDRSLHYGFEEASKVPLVDHDQSGLNTSTAGSVDVDVNKRKQLPAWIREGLERMEREKTKKMEKEQEDRERLEMFEQNRKIDAYGLETESNERFNQTSAQDEDSSEAEKESIHERKDHSSSRFDEGSNSDTSDEEDESDQEEERERELMLRVKKLMTEVLLEVTDEIIRYAVRDCVSKLRNSRVSASKQLATSTPIIQSAGLGGLVSEYASDSDASDQDKESTSLVKSRKSNENSSSDQAKSKSSSKDKERSPSSNSRRHHHRSESSNRKSNSSSSNRSSRRNSNRSRSRSRERERRKSDHRSQKTSSSSRKNRSRSRSKGRSSNRKYRSRSREKRSRSRHR
ncbi:uncharacterized protein LOC141857156 [Brevipalpus obovatus]|uniref:uncharacterized protein LOC141857156 n=1 Tax=Brevipalpus obovatus TaxID=246614 RepID=UPI003D9EF649